MSVIDFELCDFTVSSKEVAYSVVTQVMSKLDFLVSDNKKMALYKSLIGYQGAEFAGKLSAEDSFVKFVDVDDAGFVTCLGQKLNSILEMPQYRLVILWYQSCIGVEHARLNMLRSFKNLQLLRGCLDENEKEYVKELINEWEQYGQEVRNAQMQEKFEENKLEAEFEDIFREIDGKTNGVVVCDALGDVSGNDGRAISKRYANIVGRKLDVIGGNIMAKKLYDDLYARFPWAKEAILRITGQIAISQKSSNSGIIRIPPILLVGEPGSGKTKFSTALGEHLNIPVTVVPLGGTADSGGLLPVARGWATSRACGPVNAMLAHEIANPILVLDELDKAAGGGNVNSAQSNGSVMGALLSMMNGDGRYFDTCLQANVDLSYVGFIATANTLKGIPDAVLDRFFVIKLPTPTSKYFDVIFEGIQKDEAKKFACEISDLPQLDEFEIEDLRVMMDDKGSSIRSIQRAYRMMIGNKALFEDHPEISSLMGF